MEEQKKGVQYLTNEQIEQESYEYDTCYVTIDENRTSGFVEILFLYRQHDVVEFTVKRTFVKGNNKRYISLSAYYPPRTYQQICRDINTKLHRLDKKKTCSTNTHKGKREANSRPILHFKPKSKPNGTA